MTWRVGSTTESSAREGEQFGCDLGMLIMAVRPGLLRKEQPMM